MAFMAAALLASCSDKNNDYSGDFGQIKVPATRQLEQTVTADDTQTARGVPFTTEGAWTSTIAEKTRAEAPDWIGISPDHGDAAGSYTLKINLQPNDSEESRTATIVINCGTSKIEITITQEGSDNPITPTLNSRISKIECYYEEEEHPEKNRQTANYHFEYDDRNRVTKCTFENLEDSSEEIDQVVTFTYPDASTLKIVASGEDQRETLRYTAALDAAGRAVEVRHDDDASRWTFSYDAGGRCTECRQSGVEESTVYPRTAFGWKNGNLTSIDTFDNAGKPVKAYSFTCTYTEQKNSPQAMSIDLNALLFDVCPAYMPVYGPDLAQVLATAGRLGVRSADLTKTNLMDEELAMSSTPSDPNILCFYEILPENEIIEWELDNDGRVKRVFYTARVLYIKENLTSGQKDIVPEKCYTLRRIYIVSY